MTRRIPASLALAAAAALALTACGPAAASSANHRNPGAGGFGAVETDPSPDSSVTATATADADQSPPPADPAPAPSASKSGNGKGNGAGGGSGYGNGTGDGPKIVTFTATGAVCPVDAKPGAPYSQPGQVTLSWKISSTDGVSLAMDGGLWSTYPGQNGSATLPFQCPDKTKSNTHTFTLSITGHAGATKTISASARPNP